MGQLGGLGRDSKREAQTRVVPGHAAGKRQLLICRCIVDVGELIVYTCITPALFYYFVLIAINE